MANLLLPTALQQPVHKESENAISEMKSPFAEILMNPKGPTKPQEDSP